MRGSRRIAQQHDILVVPCFAQHTREFDPCRSTHVVGIRHQRVAPQMRRKDALAGGDAVFLAHRFKAKGVIGRLRTFHDKGRRVRVELIGVRPDPTVFCLLEDKGESVVKFLMRSQPDKRTAAHVDVGLERVLKFKPRLGIQPVTGDNQIVVVHIRAGTADLGFELQIDTQLAGTCLQQAEQRPTPDPTEPVTGADDPLPLVEQRNVVPIGEMLANGFGADRIVCRQIAQCFVGQHHAPAKGVIRFVPLDYGDLCRRIAQL